MNRWIIALLVSSALAGCAAPLQPVVVSGGGSATSKGSQVAGAYAIGNGLVDAVVSPATGRIVRFGFVGGANLLWENPSAVDATTGEWANWGGDKVWVWPQGDWKRRTGRAWPPPGDPPPVPFEVMVKRDGLVMTSPLLPAFGVRLVREITMRPGQPTMTVVNRFDVVDETMADGIALWNVSQVPAPDEVIATPIYPRTPAGQTRPTFPKQMMQSTEPWPAPQPSLVHAADLIFKRPRTARAKIGVDADALRVRVGDVFLAQRASFSPSTGALEPSERAQLYTQPGRDGDDPSAYVELEFTSPVWDAADVARGSLTVTWTLWRPEK